jgi:hypothetical protein
MKKLIITSLLMICFYTLKAQTTWIEYKYLKNGVVDYLDRGIDLKTGYELVKAGDYSLNFRDGIRQVTIYDFIKIDNRNHTALLLVYNNQRSNKKTYLVIPSKNSPQEMWNDYAATLSTITPMTMGLQTISYALAQYTSNKL